MCQISINPDHFNFFLIFKLDHLDLAGGKYFIKIIFDIKIKIGIFETSNVP